MVTGFIVATIVSIVIFGGIKRIALVASRMVPVMVGIYLIAAIIVIGKNFQLVPGIISLIVTDAFSGNAVAGGSARSY